MKLECSRRDLSFSRIGSLGLKTRASKPYWQHVHGQFGRQGVIWLWEKESEHAVLISTSFIDHHAWINQGRGGGTFLILFIDVLLQLCVILYELITCLAVV